MSLSATEILRTQDKAEYCAALHARLTQAGDGQAAARAELQRLVRELLYMRHIDEGVREVRRSLAALALDSS